MAASGDDVVGVLTYVIEGDSLEVVSIDAVPPGHGAGTALLAAAVELGAYGIPLFDELTLELLID